VTTFADDFNRANSTDLGAGWVEVSGDWSIVSNQLSPGSAGGTIILRAATAMATSDHYAQVTIAATAAVSQGVWARGNSNISQGYLWRNNGTSWDLFSVVGGSFVVIGTYTAAAAPGDVAKIQVVGSAIKGYVNGVLRVSVTDTAVTTGTSVGIRSESSGSVKYDDFFAGDIVNGATLGIASASESAQTLTGAKSATAGIAAATEAAQPFAGAKAASLGIAAATETAQPVTGTKTTTLGTASTSEAAQQLAGAKTALLGTATATETAQPLTGSLSATLSPASTSETAQPLTGSKTALLGTAVEAATAQALAGAKTAALPTAGEADAAQPLTVAAGQTLGIAGAVETAMPLTGTKIATLGTAGEADTARPLIVPSTIVQSPERTYQIAAEPRRLVVAAESRTLTVR
jgi:hypothetical protein